MNSRIFEPSHLTFVREYDGAGTIRVVERHLTRANHLHQFCCADTETLRLRSPFTILDAFIGLIVKLTDESLDAINECTAGDLAFFALRSVRRARLYHYR